MHCMLSSTASIHTYSNDVFPFRDRRKRKMLENSAVMNLTDIQSMYTASVNLYYSWKISALFQIIYTKTFILLYAVFAIL